MRAGRVLRQLIIARIIAEVPVLGGRVFDKAVEGTATPYVTMGPSYWVDDSSECITSRAQTVQIDIWDEQSNKGVVEDIVDDIAAALSGYADESLLTMHPMNIVLSPRVEDDPDGIHIHGFLQVEAMVEG